jgi:peroxiredoxin
MSFVFLGFKKIRLSLYVCLGAIILLASSSAIFAQSQDEKNVKNVPLKVNETVPDFSLSDAISQEDKHHLGLLEQGATFHDIDSEFMLVEVFSIYCPQCQRIVGNLNNLYKMIQADPVCKENIKMIGIGVGNNMTEVEYFRKYYTVSFPLLPDPDFSIHKILKSPRTPFIFLAIKENDRLKVQAVFDPLEKAKEKFAFLQAELKKTIPTTDVAHTSTEEYLHLKKHCLLWDHPQGKPIFCIVSNTKAKRIESHGEQNGCCLIGWLFSQ